MLIISKSLFLSVSVWGGDVAPANEWTSDITLPLNSMITYFDFKKSGISKWHSCISITVIDVTRYSFGCNR